MSLTTNEIIEELIAAQKAHSNPEGFFSTQEYAEMLNKPLSSVRQRLKTLKAVGRLSVGTKTTVSLDDKVRPVQAYRVEPEGG